MDRGTDEELEIAGSKSDDVGNGKHVGGEGGNNETMCLSWKL
jgi:hypothetical protein